MEILRDFTTDDAESVDIDSIVIDVIKYLT